ncbi:MAG: leucine-rich repeat protein, partial [Ruminococcus sp.]
MKRFIAATLVVIMLLSCVPTSVFASEVSAEQSQSEYTYSVSGDNAVITHYNGDDMFVDIPNSIDGYNVTEIASSAFNNVDDVRGIEIPEGVEKLQSGIFTNCSNVEYISLPSTLKDIEDGVLNANSDCVYIVERNSQADTYATQNDLNFRRRFASDLVSDA